MAERRYEAVIVGAGIAGLTAAWTLLGLAIPQTVRVRANAVIQ